MMGRYPVLYVLVYHMARMIGAPMNIPIQPLTILKNGNTRGSPLKVTMFQSKVERGLNRPIPLTLPKIVTRLILFGLPQVGQLK